MSDAAAKAQHATRLMHAARDLAAVAPSDRQQRILARYVVMHADTALRDLCAWQRDLRSTAATRSLATAAKTPLRRLRQEFAKQKQIRDKLASRRQAVASRRAPDLRGTVALWGQLSHSGVTALCAHAAAACAALGSTEPVDTPVPPELLATAVELLHRTRLDPARVYTDATSYASGEPNLLAAAISGLDGRRIMQINDVHDHLEELNALGPVAARTDDLGLLLRSALVVEICALLELTFARRSRRSTSTATCCSPTRCSTGSTRPRARTSTSACWCSAIGTCARWSRRPPGPIPRPSSQRSTRDSSTPRLR